MEKVSYKDRIFALREGLGAVPIEKLVDALVGRAVYDESLCKYLEVLAKSEGADIKAEELFDTAKKFIATVYGSENLDEQGASYIRTDLKAAHSVVEQLFAKGHYAQVIQLFDWSLQFEESLSGAVDLGDPLDTAYMPLALLCLRSHLRLGKSPEEVANIFRAMGEADEFGLFYKMPVLWPKYEADLAPVRKILEGR